jgi:hypothetical protein
LPAPRDLRRLVFTGPFNQQGEVAKRIVAIARFLGYGRKDMIRGYHVLRPHEALKRGWRRLGYVVRNSTITDYVIVVVDGDDAVGAFESDMKARRHKVNCFFEADSNPQVRIMPALENAMRAFWESVAESFPEAETGDFGPTEQIMIEMAMEEAIRTWVRFNVEAKRQNKSARTKISDV